MSDQKSFVEYPFAEAVKLFPVIKSMFPLKLLLEFSSEDGYIVRIANDRIEIGYFDDDRFTLGALSNA